MNIWNLTKKDLTVFFKDRGALLWIFVLPLVFIILFSGLSGGTGSSSGAEEDQRSPIYVVNLDEGGEIAARFLASLDRAGGYRVELLSQDEAEQRVNKLRIARYLAVPAGFSANLAQGQPVGLELVVHPNADARNTQLMLQVVNGVARDTSLELQILDGIRQMGKMQTGNPDAQMVFDTERTLAQAKSQFENSRQRPLVGVVQQSAQLETAQEEADFNLAASMVPGITVLFVFLSAQTVARNIYEEKKAGSLRRLLSAPLKRWELLAGKMLPTLILTMVQIMVIFAVGALLLPILGLGQLGIGNDPLAWLLTSLLMALCSASLGILIAALAKTEGQISGLSNALLWVAGFLGGALMPAFLLQRIAVLGFLSRLMPQYWAISAYYDVLARGKTLVDVLPNMGVLLGVALLFFVIGVRRFRFD